MTESPKPGPRKTVVAERAGWCCEYCRSQARFCPDPFVVEHVVPRSRGGSDDLSNLAFACQGCNGHKYTSLRVTWARSGSGIEVGAHGMRPDGNGFMVDPRQVPHGRSAPDRPKRSRHLSRNLQFLECSW